MGNGHPPLHAPRPRTVKPRQSLDFDGDYKRSPQFDSVVEKWDDFEIPESPPPVPTQFLNQDSDSGSSETIVAPAKSPSKDHFQDASFDYKQAMVAYISTGHLPTPDSSKREQVNRTPASNNLLSAPITIIVTSPSPTPDQEQRPAGQPHERQDSSIMSRNIRKSAINSNPTPYKPHLNLDTSRLMPPPDHQVNVRKLRKVDEFGEIRSFLINFMNARGDQFPKKLRKQMMELYGIQEAELAPELKAKFEREQDEGVALDQQKETSEEGKNGSSHAESLEILKMAFRSQMSEFAPKIARRPGDVAITHRSRTSSIIKTQSPRPPLPSPEEEEEEEEDNIPPTWLAPLISRSAAEHPQHLLRQSYSAPSLHSRPQRPPSKTTRSSSSIPTIRDRHDSLKLKQTRVKRGLISGAFGAVREAMGGGRSRGKEGG